MQPHSPKLCDRNGELNLQGRILMYSTIDEENGAVRPCSTRQARMLCSALICTSLGPSGNVCLSMCYTWPLTLYWPNSHRAGSQQRWRNRDALLRSDSLETRALILRVNGRHATGRAPDSINGCWLAEITLCSSTTIAVTAVVTGTTAFPERTGLPRLQIASEGQLLVTAVWSLPLIKGQWMCKWRTSA